LTFQATRRPSASAGSTGRRGQGINLIAQDSIEHRVLEMIKAKAEVFRKVIDWDISDPEHESNFWEVLFREF